MPDRLTRSSPAVRLARITSHDSVLRAARQQVDSEAITPRPCPSISRSRTMRATSLSDDRHAAAERQDHRRVAPGCVATSVSESTSTLDRTRAPRRCSCHRHDLCRRAHECFQRRLARIGPPRPRGPGQTPRPANLDRSEPPRPSAPARRHDPTRPRLGKTGEPRPPPLDSAAMACELERASTITPTTHEHLLSPSASSRMVLRMA
jgi:hypothetical protein